MIDEDLIGGALVEEADGDQHISSMTTFELAQVRSQVYTSNISVCTAQVLLKFLYRRRHATILELIPGAVFVSVVRKQASIRAADYIVSRPLNWCKSCQGITRVQSAAVVGFE